MQMHLASSGHLEAVRKALQNVKEATESAVEQMHRVPLHTLVTVSARTLELEKSSCGGGTGFAASSNELETLQHVVSSDWSGPQVLGSPFYSSCASRPREGRGRVATDFKVNKCQQRTQGISCATCMPFRV